MKHIGEITYTHRYAMGFPGMRAKVIKSWTAPNGTVWLRLYFGTNKTGQRLMQTVPANVTDWGHD